MKFEVTRMLSPQYAVVLIGALKEPPDCQTIGLVNRENSSLAATNPAPSLEVPEGKAAFSPFGQIAKVQGLD